MLLNRRTQDLVYDVGMYEGEDTDFYLKRGFRVVGIEANPTLVTKLRGRFAREIQEGRLILVDKAIARTPGQVMFAVNRREDVWGSISPEFIERNRSVGANCDYIPVEAVRFADVIRANGIPHYMKIDIEGMDIACIEDLHDFRIRPKYLSLESAVTFDIAETEKAFSELAHLWVLGYRRFKYVDQSLLRKLDGMLLDKEGYPVRYSYAQESSGPFGDESPGEWQSIEQAHRTMRRLIVYQNLIGFRGRWHAQPWSRVGQRLRRCFTGRPSHSWYDLHACLGDGPDGLEEASDQPPIARAATNADTQGV